MIAALSASPVAPSGIDPLVVERIAVGLAPEVGQ